MQHESNVMTFKKTVLRHVDLLRGAAADGAAVEQTGVG
jgi:hypothetical protein